MGAPRQRAVAHEATAAGAETLSGPAWAWDVYCHPAISALAFTPKAWPVVLELTGGQPMMRLGIGLHDAPHSGGGGMLHCNREFQRSSAVGSPSMASYSVRDGRILCADFGMFVCAAPLPHPTTPRTCPQPSQLVDTYRGAVRTTATSTTWSRAMVG